MFSEKADRLSFETQARRPTDWCCCLCTRAMGKGVCCVTQKNGCGSILVLPQLFCLEVERVQAEKNMILTKAEKQLIEVIRSLDYGEVRVMIKDNKPIRVEEIRRSIQLPNEK